MQKAKKFDIEDSNIALLGSKLEKDVKLAAAQTEEAWKGAGKQLGIQVWRIEKFEVKHWPKEQYGKFYDGDSYIVLHTYKESEDAEKFSFDVFFWIGSESSQDEYGTAAYKTVELDDYLGGDPIQHREIQGHESKLFLELFPAFEVLKGGVDSGFNHVEPKEYKPRLLHVKGKKNIVVRQVDMAADSVNEGDVFILDDGLMLYQWNGKKASIMEKNKGAELCRNIDSERSGKPEVLVIDQGDRDEKKFWEFLGGKPAKINDAVPDTVVKGEKKLFKLSDADGSLKFTELPKVSLDLLDGDDVFILDAVSEVFVWVGKGSSKAEKKNAMGYATDYLFKNNRDKFLPITRIPQGGESAHFKSFF